MSQDNNKKFSIISKERYEPKVSEKKWQKFWEIEGVYKFDPNSEIGL